MTAEPMAYIGRCPKCNSIVLATVDEPRHRDRVAADLAEAVRDGLVVERVTCQYVRDNWTACTCDEQAEQLPLVTP